MKKSFVKNIEDAVWPKTLSGWFFVGLLVIGSVFLMKESSGFFINYLKIINWSDVSGHLIKADVAEGRIHVLYKYKIDEAEVVGERIGFSSRVWHEVSPRQIKNIENILQNSLPISIKINPQDKAKSIYIFNWEDLYFALFVLFFPAALMAVFLVALVSKLKNHND